MKMFPLSPRLFHSGTLPTTTTASCQRIMIQRLTLQSAWPRETSPRVSSSPSSTGCGPIATCWSTRVCLPRQPGRLSDHSPWCRQDRHLGNCTPCSARETGCFKSKVSSEENRGAARGWLGGFSEGAADGPGCHPGADGQGGQG